MSIDDTDIRYERLDGSYDFSNLDFTDDDNKDTDELQAFIKDEALPQ